MIADALARRAHELGAAGVGFVWATVVRAQSPTSVEAGSVALVHADGTIEGFVGGVCAEHSVRAYSLLALQSGEPVLLRILPDAVEGDVGPAGAEVASEDGAVTVKNPCLSGGAIEVFLEPALPDPRVLVVGDTPIAGAVRQIGAELGPIRGPVISRSSSRRMDVTSSGRSAAASSRACRTSASSPATSAAPA
jgi:xanthine dehydrogenase accessory factor